MSNIGFIMRGLGLAACLVVAGAATAQAGETGEQRRAATIVAPVVSGVQIYECTRALSGATSYTQLNVRATLKGNIKHNFVAPAAGPPQWYAVDGSRVTGRVISRNPSPLGPGNIDELELEATQIGSAGGLLSTTTRILRLNTRGGVAPAGPCTPGDVEEVPYKADYHFISD